MPGGHSYDIQTDTTVLGGFPVTACANVDPADRSVGIWDDNLVDLSLFHPKSGKWLGWLEKRMSDKDWALLREELWEQRSDDRDYWAEYKADCRREAW
jgi:hypothetical protein